MDRDPSRDCEHGHLRRKCLICDLREELAAERETSEWLRKEITAWLEREQKTEAALKAIRTDLDTHHRDPGYCDLAWLVTRVQMHIGYKPWEPARRQKGSFTDGVKFALRKRFGEPVHATLRESDIPYLEGLKDAAVVGAVELIEAVEKYGEIVVTEEY